MQSLDQQELLLSLSQQLHALLVVADDHARVHLVTLSLRLYLKVHRTLLELFDPQVLGLHTVLEVELPALFEGLLAGISVTLEVFEEALRVQAIRVQHVFNDFQAEDVLLQLCLVSQELLLL